MAVDEQDIPENGAVFSFGKSHFADNLPSKFWIRNDKILQMSCGDEHTAVVTESGRLFVFGGNKLGQLGQGYPNSAEKPTCVKSLKQERVRKVSCGKSHTIVLTESGRVYGFGDNTEGQLGQNNSKELTKPEIILESTFQIENLSCGANDSVVLTNEGTLLLLGNTWDKCLKKNNSEETSLTQLKLDYPIINFSCGYNHLAFITSESKLFLLGEREREKLTESQDIQQVLEQVQIPEKLIKVSCGEKHTAVLTADGKLYTFGDGKNGQLGLGNRILESDVPCLVTALQNLKLKDVECGENHTSVITENGTLFVFGDGRFGKLGLGNENFSNQFWPCKVSIFKDFEVEKVSCGGCQTMVLAKIRSSQDIKLFGDEDVDPSLTTIKEGIEDIRRNRKDNSSNLKLPPLKLPGKPVESNVTASLEDTSNKSGVEVVEESKNKQDDSNEDSTRMITNNERLEVVQEMEKEIEAEAIESQSESALLTTDGEELVEEKPLKTDDDKSLKSDSDLENDESVEMDENIPEDETENVPDEVIAFMNTQINVLPASSSPEEIGSESDVMYDNAANGKTEYSLKSTENNLEESPSNSRKNSVGNIETSSPKVVSSKTSEVIDDKAEDSESGEEEEGEEEEEESEVEESEITSSNVNYGKNISKKDLEEASNSKLSEEASDKSTSKLQKKKSGGNFFNRMFGTSFSKEKPSDVPDNETDVNPTPKDSLPSVKKEQVPAAPQSSLLCVSTRRKKSVEGENVKVETTNQPEATNPPKSTQSVTCDVM